MLKAPSMHTKGTFALLSPVCSIPLRVFLSCGTSPYYNRSLYRRGGRKPGLRAYHHHSRQRRLLWRLAYEHLFLILAEKQKVLFLAYLTFYVLCHYPKQGMGEDDFIFRWVVIEEVVFRAITLSPLFF